MTQLLASCSNCRSWTTTPDLGHATSAGQGFCARGLHPEPGKLLCGQYQITEAFRQQVLSSMLKDHGPMAMPVKLVGGRRSAKEHNRKAKRGG